MTEYRHVTNLQTPYDDLDQRLLQNLGVENTDYVIADPIVAHVPNATPFDALKANGIVGLYTTYDSLQGKTIKAQTGWTVSASSWQHLPVLNG